MVFQLFFIIIYWYYHYRYHCYYYYHYYYYYYFDENGKSIFKISEKCKFKGCNKFTQVASLPLIFSYKTNIESDVSVGIIRNKMKSDAC